MDNSQDINLKDLRAYVEQLEEQRDLLVAERQDILDKRVEEVLKDGDKTLSERKQRKRDALLDASKQRYQSISEQLTKIERSLFIAKDALSKELTFRKDLSVSQEELREVQRKTREYEEALAYMKHPAVEGDPVEHARAMKAVQDAYKALTGEEFEADKFDEAALREKVRHVGTKAQHKVDEVFGNVDDGEVSRDRRELEDIEKGIQEAKERQADYAAARKILKGMDAKDPKDLADMQKRIKDYRNKRHELKVAKDAQQKISDAIDALNKEIEKLQQDLEAKQKELEKLLLEKNPDPNKVAELEKQIQGLQGQIGAKQQELTTKQGELTAAEQAVTDRQTEVDGLAVGLEDYIELTRLISKLGIMDGDKPLDFKGDVDVALKAVNKSSRNEHLATKKKELQEKAALILDKYDVEVPKKGDFANTLDERVAEIKKNYNPAHIQAGWERPGVKKEEAPEQQTEPAGPGNPGGGPAGAPMPGGSGTRATNPGGPGTQGGGHGPSMPMGGGSYGHGGFSGGPMPTGTGTPVGSPAPTQTEEQTQENSVTRDIENELSPAFAVAKEYEELGEPISGDVDLRTLVDQPGMTKVQNGYVYRVVPLVPKNGDIKDREYQPIREPVDWYFEGTSSKLKNGIKDMIEAIKEMDEDEQARAVDKLSATQKKQMEKILKGGFGSRSSEKKFIKDILKRDPKTQVDLLIAYSSSAGLPELMAEATGFLDGNPYQKPTDLVVRTEQPKGLFKRWRKDKLKPVTLENNVENLLDGYKHLGEPSGTRRENGRNRDHNRTRNPRDVGERD